ncbi:Heterogeneous nuclear ribonucleoprotein K [Holothuria leucospilota]|uniref:Heterogeneous nuclear ribonucleoprotein K n=1 Tax=Holothuria leucospilota TaxID=206669 RepID=A0A9Q1BMC8_HOLLE|nr:Heterogeneous nuclear ribonucleoprotein K [Holothuria leucospilota]
MAEQEQIHMVDQEGVDHSVDQMAAGGGAKRTAEESHHSGNSPSNKKARGDDDFYGLGEGPEVTLRFLIQSVCAGPIIGKGGLNIKRLRSEYNADVKIPDCDGPERVLTLSGKFGDVMGCLEDLMPCLKDTGPRGRRGEQQRSESDDCEARLLVHQSSAGAIIGRAGFKIKELREKSSATIKVYSECCPHSFERVIQFQGTVAEVVAGIRETVKVVQDAPIKGPVQLYDPLLLNCRNYGGRRPDHGDGPPPFGSFPPYQSSLGGPDRGGRGPLMPMRGPRGQRNDGRGYGPGGSGGPNRRQRNDGYDFSRDRDMDNFSFEGKSFEGGDDHSVTKTQVTIPKDLAGSIIGNGGERIKKIRKDSGAKIKIDEPLPGSNVRIITIEGDQHAITNAQYLLQLSVRQYSGKSGY